MTLRRFASLSLLTASFAFMMAGTTSCVVSSRGRSGHPANHGHHHCHKAKGCHSHGHGPGHHP